MDINFYSTQVLSGHGNFSDHLKKFTLKDDPTRTDCNRHEIDSVEHMLFGCPAWTDLRKEYKVALQGSYEKKMSNFRATALRLLITSCL
ncbi:UNVERIFIED_CONTAM: hypothetical protein PYX00_000128 [Menopon gallinae]|uniref:Reverse transcriptase n=1 Tax=Menopon gallinae TaxID=328185 RepID=A0AAW2I8P5_9NEOP